MLSNRNIKNVEKNKYRKQRKVKVLRDISLYLCGGAMVLADLGRKITTALRSLSNATVINEEVSKYFQSEFTSSGQLARR